MKPRGVIGALALAGLVASAGPAAAQDLTAEVRTWGGQTLRLAQPFLEVSYTMMPKAEDAGAEPAIPAAPMLARLTGVAIQPLGPPGRRAPEPQQGRRQREVVPLFRDGVEVQVPLVNIASLLFFRVLIPTSPLPPYEAITHFRYSGVAVLMDGSRVEGDYINLGTTLLRGITPQGLVAIPWEEIEVVRFER